MNMKTATPGEIRQWAFLLESRAKVLRLPTFGRELRDAFEALADRIEEEMTRATEQLEAAKAEAYEDTHLDEVFEDTHLDDRLAEMFKL